MSARQNYAMSAAVLTDFVLTCGSDKEAIEVVVAHIANGGSVRDLCTHYGLDWGVLWAWIRKDNGRNGMYEGAMMARGEYRREALLDGWWGTANMEVEDRVTHGDVHKARDALAKVEGMYDDGAKVKVDTQITIVHRSE